MTSIRIAWLTAWKSNYGVARMAAKVQGASNLDGDVDGADFYVWQQTSC